MIFADKAGSFFFVESLNVYKSEHAVKVGLLGAKKLSLNSFWNTKIFFEHARSTASDRER